MAKNEMVPQEKVLAFKALVTQCKARMAELLPQHVTAERMVQVAMLAASRQPKLYECAVDSIQKSLMQAAELGLETTGSLGSAYLVPYWNTHRGCRECQFIPGYRGLMDLARRSSMVRAFSAHVVYSADRFEVEYGINERLVHVPALSGDRGKRVAVYAIAYPTDGDAPQFEVLLPEEVEHIKASSASRDKETRELVGPWVDHEDEMWRKSAVRRLCKYLPLSPSMVRAFEIEDENADAMETTARDVTDEKPALTRTAQLKEGIMPKQAPEPAETAEQPQSLSDVFETVPDHDQDAPPEKLGIKAQALCLRAQGLGVSREALEAFTTRDATAWYKPERDRLTAALDSLVGLEGEFLAAKRSEIGI